MNATTHGDVPLTRLAQLCSFSVYVVSFGSGCITDTFDDMDSRGRVMSPVSVAIVRQNLQVDEEMRLVARVEVQPNEILEFFEPAPGELFLSGAGAPKGPLKAKVTFEGRDVDYGELWRAASENAPMPQALIDAIARADAKAHDRASHRDTGTGGVDDDDVAPQPFVEHAADHHHPEEGVGVSAHALHGNGWCNTTYETHDIPNAPSDSTWHNIGQNCPTVGYCAFYDETHCWDHGTGNAHAQNPETFLLRSNVCPYGSGAVIFRFESDEWSTAQWAVDPNTTRWLWRMDGGCDWDAFDDCAWMKTSVSDSSPTEPYNYRFLAHDEDYNYNCPG